MPTTTSGSRKSRSSSRKSDTPTKTTTPRTPSRKSVSKQTTDVLHEAADSKRNTVTNKDIYKLASWAYLWILLSTFVVIWDASFVLLRPRSLAKGDLFNLFQPYALYITIDKMYGDVNSAFVKAQSAMNLIEVLVSYIGLYIYNKQHKSNNKVQLRIGLLILLCSAAATLAKTILYGLHDYYHEPSYTSHNAWGPYILLYLIPNGLWIVLPAAVCVHIATKLAYNGSSSRSKKSE